MSVLPFRRRLDAEPLDDSPTARPRTVGAVATDLDELEIMGRLASGDPAALEFLVDVYWGPLLSYASRLLDDLDAGQDVVQTAFIRLWSKRTEWKPGSLKAYLFRLTRNLVVDELRRRGASARALGLSSRDVQAVPRNPSQLAEDSETRSEVDRAIQALAPRRREVFTLAHLRGFSYREIAETMDISVKTVENHMSAALSELRRSLSGSLAR